MGGGIFGSLLRTFYTRRQRPFLHLFVEREIMEFSVFPIVLRRRLGGTEGFMGHWVGLGIRRIPRIASITDLRDITDILQNRAGIF